MDIYITQWDNMDKIRKWATYYGGSSYDYVTDIEYDVDGGTDRLYIVGNTSSSDLSFLNTAGSYHQGPRAAGYAYGGNLEASCAGYIFSIDSATGYANWGTYITGMYDPIPAGANQGATIYSGRVEAKALDIDEGKLVVAGDVYAMNTTDLKTQNVSNEAFSLKKYATNSYYSDQFIPYGNGELRGITGFINVFSLGASNSLEYSTLIDFDSQDFLQR